jgi:hypothetical protein
VPERTGIESLPAFDAVLAGSTIPVLTNGPQTVGRALGYDRARRQVGEPADISDGPPDVMARVVPLDVDRCEPEGGWARVGDAFLLVTVQIHRDPGCRPPPAFACAELFPAPPTGAAIGLFPPEDFEFRFFRCASAPADPG